MLFIASDHAGFEMKAALIKKLAGQSISVTDLGTNSTESCDYPDFAVKLCHEVLKDSENRGLLICGTGIGMSIAANKVKGVRAACVSESKSAEMSRAHNNAQVLCLGARIISVETALECLNVFLKTKFDLDNPRHQRRIDKMAAIEK